MIIIFRKSCVESNPRQINVVVHELVKMIISIVNFRILTDVFSCINILIVNEMS